MFSLTELCLKTITKNYLKVYRTCENPGLIREIYCADCHPELSTFLNNIIPGFSNAIRKIYGFCHNKTEFGQNITPLPAILHCADLEMATQLLEANELTTDTFTFAGTVFAKQFGKQFYTYTSLQQTLNNVIYCLRGQERIDFSIGDRGIVSFYTVEDAINYIEKEYPGETFTF